MIESHNLKRPIAESMIPKAFEHMLGTPRGLVRTAFMDKISELLDRRLANLSKSVVHRLFDGELGDPPFRVLPSILSQRFRMVMFLCDVLETLAEEEEEKSKHRKVETETGNEGFKETENVAGATVCAKRGPGRPKGSRNKPGPAIAVGGPG